MSLGVNVKSLVLLMDEQASVTFQESLHGEQVVATQGDMVVDAGTGELYHVPVDVVPQVWKELNGDGFLR